MDHTPKSIQLVGRIAIDLAHRNEFIDRTTTLSNLTKANESPLLYQCCEDIKAAGNFVFYEIWPSRESLDGHFLTAHFLEWNDWVADKTLSEPEIRIGLIEATATLSS